MLQPNQEQLDLGTLKFGVPHNFTYTLTNTSDKVVNIDKVHVGCASCTTVSLNKTKASPGEDILINGVFTPGSTGINMKNVSIDYIINDIPLHLPLKFKANVIV